MTSLNVPVLSVRVEAFSEFDIKTHLWVRDLHPFLEELIQTTQITYNWNNRSKHRCPNLRKRNEHKNGLFSHGKSVFSWKETWQNQDLRWDCHFSIQFLISHQISSSVQRMKMKYRSCAFWNLIAWLFLGVFFYRKRKVKSLSWSCFSCRSIFSFVSVCVSHWSSTTSEQSNTWHLCHLKVSPW